MRTNLGIEHFDTHAVVWQPTFESLLFHIEGRFPKSGSSQSSNESLTDDLGVKEQDLEFNIRTEMDMKLAFTVALLKDLGLLGNELNSLKNFESPVDVMEDFKPYILRNDSGAKLQFWFPMSEAFTNSNKTTVDTYEVYKFGLPIEQQATGVGLGQRRARVNIKIDGYKKIGDVSIDTLGEHYYILESDDEEECERILKWTVKLNAGAREIQASSAFSLKNCTPWVLEARTSSTQFSKLEAPAHSYTIEPGKRIYAPVSFSKNYRLDVKLFEEDTDWGVVHSTFKQEFFGINAPLNAFRDANNRSVAVTFRKHGIPLLSLIHI